MLVFIIGLAATVYLVKTFWKPVKSLIKMLNKATEEPEEKVAKPVKKLPEKLKSGKLFAKAIRNSKMKIRRLL